MKKMIRRWLGIPDADKLKDIEQRQRDRYSKMIHDLIDKLVKEHIDNLINGKKTTLVKGSWCWRHRSEEYNSVGHMIEQIIIREIGLQASKAARNEAQNEIYGEEFINGIIRRINEKQLSG